MQRAQQRASLRLGQRAVLLDVQQRRVQYRELLVRLVSVFAEQARQIE
jgi:hypothetical protein